MSFILSSGTSKALISVILIIGLAEPTTFAVSSFLTYDELRKAVKYIASILSSSVILIAAQNDGIASPAFSSLTYAASYGVESFITTSPLCVYFSSSICLPSSASPKSSLTITPDTIALGTST